VISTFSGFSGALMATLTGKDSKEQSEKFTGGNAASRTISNPTTTNAPAAAISEPAAVSASGTPKIDGPVS